MYDKKRNHKKIKKRRSFRAVFLTALICAVDLCPATWIPCKYRFNQIPPSNVHFGTYHLLWNHSDA